MSRRVRELNLSFVALFVCVLLNAAITCAAARPSSFEEASILRLPDGEDESRLRVMPSGSNTYMDCGTATVCGVLTLETGWGGGLYGHASPTVHGLWPQVPPYGNSACLRPKNKAPADYDWKHPELLKCYNTELPKSYTKKDYSQEYGFETHEWGKHGMCCGVKDAKDFLDTVCDLSERPLKVIQEAENDGATDINSVAEALKDAGFPVYYVDGGYTKQIELSLCAGTDRAWQFSAPKDFDRLCGSGGPFPPSPRPAEECVPMQHGPPCSSNSDCDRVPGCVRCANSGFCTDVELIDVAAIGGAHEAA